MTSGHRPTLISGKSYGRPFFLLLLAAVASVAFSQSSVSQQSATASGEIIPRGQREVSDVTYGGWKKLCFKPGGAPRRCRTSITGTFATGQMAIRVDIIERDDGTGRLQVFCPVGMYLQNPVKLAIDQGATLRLPYTWCLTNSCIAAAVAEPQLLKQMTAGRVLRLEFVDSRLLSLVATLPLSQFALVHKGEPAQTFEQDIDE